MVNQIKHISSPTPGKDTTVVAKQEAAPLGPVTPGFKRFAFTKLSKTTSEIVEAKTETDYEIERYATSSASIQTSLEEEASNFSAASSRSMDAPYPSHVRVNVKHFGASILDDSFNGWELRSSHLARQVMDDIEFDTFLDDYSEAVDSNSNLEASLVQLLNAIIHISRRYDDPDEEPAVGIKFFAQRDSAKQSDHTRRRDVCVAVAFEDPPTTNIGWNNVLMLLQVEDPWSDSISSRTISEEEEVIQLINPADGLTNEILRSHPIQRLGSPTGTPFLKRKRPSYTRVGPVGEEPPPKRQRKTVHRYNTKQTSRDIPVAQKLGKHHHSNAPSLALSTDALEALSVLGNRRYILGIAICGLTARFWYLDRAGTVSTEEMSLASADFMSIFLALRFATPYQLGFETCIKGPDTTPRLNAELESSSMDTSSFLMASPLTDIALNIKPRLGSSNGFETDTGSKSSARPRNNEHFQTWPSFDEINGYRIAVKGQTYVLKRALHVTPCLYGRGTVTFLAYLSQEAVSGEEEESVLADSLTDMSREAVVKLSWVPASWPDEKEPLRIAQENGVEGLPRLYASRIVTRLSRGVRGRLVGEHLTNVPQYRDRELRIQVIGPVCIPLHSVLGAGQLAEFKAAFISLVKAHRELYTLAGVLHRDISLNNLMVRAHNHSVGILIDLDIAHIVRPPKITNNQNAYMTPNEARNLQVKIDRSTTDVHTSQTRSVGTSTDQHSPITSVPASVLPGGTIAFRALDLCQDDLPQHMYRHDLESFLYVLVWMVMTYRPGHSTSYGFAEDDRRTRHASEDVSGQNVTLETNSSSPTSAMLSQWHKGDWDDIRKSKEKFLHTSDISPTHSPLSSTWLPALQAMFREGYKARRQSKATMNSRAYVAQHRTSGVQEATTRSNAPQTDEYAQEFDEETLGGHVTYEKFIAVLESGEDNEIEL